MTLKEQREDYWISLLEFAEKQFQKPKSKKQKEQKPKPSYWFASEKIHFHDAGETPAPPAPQAAPRLAHPYDVQAASANEDADRWAAGYDTTEVDMSGYDVTDDDLADYMEYLTGR